MKTIFYAAASAAALVAFAAPASAQPAGPRVEAIVGLDAIKGNTNAVVNASTDVSGENVAGGVRVGYDMPVGTSAALGIDLEATESLAKADFSTNAELRAGRDLYAGGRLSLLASDAGNLYLTVGYTNLRLSAEAGTLAASRNLDGVRGGAGFQFNIGASSFAGVEYRYSNYEQDVIRHQVLAGFGFRF
jgi:outer membrane immunogenic protein